MKAVYKREIGSYFKSPVGWIFLAIFFAFTGYFFWYMLSYGVADISVIFDNMFMALIFLVPILTMKLMSDDKRFKTDQLLFTSPTSIGGVVLGKFFAAFTVLFAALSITVVYGLIISVFVRFGWIILLSNLIGALLLGAALISIGIFISNLTESQLAAASITFGISLTLYLLDMFKGTNSSSIIYRILGAISFGERYAPFVSGVLNYSGMIFFISVAAIFLFLTVRMQERKRWC